MEIEIIKLWVNSDKIIAISLVKYILKIKIANSLHFLIAQTPFFTFIVEHFLHFH